MALPLYKRFKSIDDAEKFDQQLALEGLQNYKYAGKIEEIFEKKGDILQELWLATEPNNEAQYTIRITELRDSTVLQHVLNEIKVLQELGLHKRIMGVYTFFRNKPYVAYVLPNYTPIRGRIVARYRFKKGEDDGFAFSDRESNVWSSNSDVFNEIKQELKQSPGILNRNSVAFVLRKVAKGLKYLHSKGYVHTQLSSSEVYMNEYCYVKLGGFGHARRIGSKNWKFTGNANFFAPEAVLPNDGSRLIDSSFDIFGFGLLALELISGRRPNYNNDQARDYLKQLLSGAKEMPCLREYSESCYQEELCIYDKDVEDFLSKLLPLDPNDRVSLEEAYKHPFIARKVNKNKAIEMWTTNEKPIEDDATQTLRGEMLGAQGRDGKLDVEHLTRILHAIRLAKKEFFPVFNHVPDEKLFGKYIGIESSVATPFIENDWSREVLDISDAQISRFDAYRRAYQLDAETQNPSEAPDYYNRNDQIFFIRTDWSDDERQLFVALQFARWFNQGFIEFADVVRLCGDVEDLFTEFVVECRNLSEKSKAELPHKLYWSTQMRRLVKNATLYDDPTTRSLCRIYSSISLHSDEVQRLKEKYDDLAQDDPVQVPSGKSLLSLSVMFRELDLNRFKKMEDVVLGEARVGDWDYDIRQRRVDRKERANRLRPLVRERRMNPNNQWNKDYLKFAEEEGHLNNQARVTKIWGAYDRDYVYKTCKVEAVDYKLTKDDVLNVYGNPFEEEKMNKEMSGAVKGLDKNLLRTKLNQERNHIDEFKQHDFVDARQSAFENKDKWDNEVRKNENLSPSKRVRIDVSKQAKRFYSDYDDPKFVYPSPAPRMGKHIRRKN